MGGEVPHFGRGLTGFGNLSDFHPPIHRFTYYPGAVCRCGRNLLRSSGSITYVSWSVQVLKTTPNAADPMYPAAPANPQASFHILACLI